MTSPDRRALRRAAALLFNRTWTFLAKRKRAPREDEEMIALAHASRALWEIVGKPVHFARGEWQVSRVYAVLLRTRPALLHARRCLALCRAHRIGGFDLAYAYEAVARASTTARPLTRAARRSSSRFRSLAEQAGASIRDPKDRAQFRRDLATVGKF